MRHLPLKKIPDETRSSGNFHSYSYTINSQAPDQKSNPQAPDRTYTSISVKTLSKALEIVTHVFAGAEKHNLTL